MSTLRIVAYELMFTYKIQVEKRENRQYVTPVP